MSLTLAPSAARTAAAAMLARPCPDMTDGLSRRAARTAAARYRAARELLPLASDDESPAAALLASVMADPTAAPDRSAVEAIRREAGVTVARTARRDRQAERVARVERLDAPTVARNRAIRDQADAFRTYVRQSVGRLASGAATVTLLDGTVVPFRPSAVSPIADADRRAAALTMAERARQAEARRLARAETARYVGAEVAALLADRGNATGSLTVREVARIDAAASSYATAAVALPEADALPAALVAELSAAAAAVSAARSAARRRRTGTVERAALDVQLALALADADGTAARVAELSADNQAERDAARGAVRSARVRRALLAGAWHDVNALVRSAAGVAGRSAAGMADVRDAAGVTRAVERLAEQMGEAAGAASAAAVRRAFTPTAAPAVQAPAPVQVDAARAARIARAAAANVRRPRTGATAPAPLSRAALADLADVARYRAIRDQAEAPTA